MRTEGFKGALLVGLVMVSLMALGATLVVAEELFFDDFDDGVADGWTQQLGTWQVINGEYFTSIPISQNAVSTVDSLTYTDCVIEVKLRIRNTQVGFRQGIVFRYVDAANYYIFIVSDEYDVIDFLRYSPGDNPTYGANLGQVTYTINPNTVYLLKVKIQGNKFTGYLNGVEVLSVIDDTFASGKVGLYGHRTDVFFDDFRVMPVIPATVDIKPDTLNLKSRARWITAYIELPLGYSVGDIDVGTVMLLVGNGNVPAEPKPTKIGDHDHDGIPDLKVRFDRRTVQAFIPSPSEYTLTIRGEVAGVPFEGSKTVSAITRS